MVKESADGQFKLILSLCYFLLRIGSQMIVASLASTIDQSIQLNNYKAFLFFIILKTHTDFMDEGHLEWLTPYGRHTNT